MKVSRIVCALAAVLISINLSLATENQAKDKDPKVLLVYSSGEPYKKMNEIKSPEELEAITTPTPVDMNSRIASKRIRDNLRKQGIAVKLARVEDMADWREILKYETIVIGSAARYWNMTWETKRFFETLFFKIYFNEGHGKYRGKTKGKAKIFAIFSTAEIVPSAESTLATMESVISDCGGNIALRMVLHEKMSLEEAYSEIDKFSAALAILSR